MIKKIILRFFQKWRITLFKYYNNCANIVGTPIIRHPVIFNGLGTVRFEENVVLGYYPSPKFYDSSIFIDARNSSSIICFGKNSFINNGAVIICDRTSITFGDNLLIGTDFQVQDSDFHGIHPDKRQLADYICKPVIIQDNVFIGNNVRIMKGVTVGRNSVIANSSVVVKDIPENMVVGGNPARVIKCVYDI